jgi:hypothetical protein
VSETVKSKLKAQFDGLDPVLLLRDIRSAQQALSDLAARGQLVRPTVAAPTDMPTFLESLATAWKDGEVRPTHRKQPTTERWWRTRADPFAHAWPVVEGWLINEPTATAKELMDRLAQIVPDVHGRPRFAKLSVCCSTKEKIAPVHPDFRCETNSLSLMGSAGRRLDRLHALWVPRLARAVPTTV